MEEIWQLPEDPLTVELRTEGERVVVAPYGDLDLGTVNVLGAELDALVARGSAAIVLDLRGLSFMDSTGLHLVIAHTSRRDARITLIDGNGPVSRLFDVTGVRSALPFEVV